MGATAKPNVWATAKPKVGATVGSMMWVIVMVSLVGNICRQDRVVVVMEVVMVDLEVTNICQGSVVVMMVDLEVANICREGRVVVVTVVVTVTWKWGTYVVKAW